MKRRRILFLFLSFFLFVPFSTDASRRARASACSLCFSIIKVVFRETRERRRAGAGEERTKSSLPKLRIVLGRTLGDGGVGGGRRTWKAGNKVMLTTEMVEQIIVFPLRSPPCGCETNGLPAILESSSPPDVEQKKKKYSFKNMRSFFFFQVAALE